jgi:tetratricopeptide (TPR) repeat protein
MWWGRSIDQRLKPAYFLGSQPKLCTRMLFPVLLLAGSVAQATGTDFSRLNALIDAGQPRRAGPALRRVLAEDPNNHEARAALGRALSVMNRCDEALVHLRAVRPTPAWKGKVAAAEATCHVRYGRLSEAQVAYEEALWMNPALLPVRHALTLLLIQQGEWEAAADQIEEIDTQEGWPHRGAILQVELARVSGEDPWVYLQELEVRLEGSRSKPALQQLHYLQGQLWLDAGAPDHAESAFARSIRIVDFHEASVLGRAEAFRRGGFVQDAQAVAWRKILHSSPLIHPIRSRILVDLGDLKGARSELSLATSPDHLETVASRWYLARAAGEPTEQLEKAWSDRLLKREQRLMDLIPLESQ